MRVVRDLQTQATTSAVRNPVDSYARPYYHDDQRLNSIVSALEKWSPTFINYQKKKDDAQYRREVAEGWALAQKYADGDYSVDSFRQMVADGKAENFRKLTKAHEHGINRFQMAEGMNRYSTQMTEWYDNAKFIDETGVERRVAEIQDPVVFDKMYAQASTDTWQKYTGGKYDPELFQESFKVADNEVHNVLFQKFMSKRAQFKQYEAYSVASKYADSALDQINRNNEIHTQPKLYAAKFSAMMTNAVDNVASTTSTKEAVEWGAKYFITSFYNKDSEGIEAVLEAASKTPKVWNDAGSRRDIQNAAEGALTNYRQEQREREFRYREYKAERGKRNFEAFVTKYYGGKYWEVPQEALKL